MMKLKSLFCLLFFLYHISSSYGANISYVDSSISKNSNSTTNSTMSKVVVDLSPFLKVYADGHIERLVGTTIVPPSLDDPLTHVKSKDVVYFAPSNLSSRLYLPKSVPTNRKLPLLVYFHGGAFCVESPFTPMYHDYINKLVSEANVVVVSVGYRLAPEHHLPTAFEDSWTALKWVASHFNGHGPEVWLNRYADFGRLYLAGDSAGGNLAHFLGMRIGKEKLDGINILGIALVDPYFDGKIPIGGEAQNLEEKSKIDAIWKFVYPTLSGLDDPVINAGLDPNLSKFGCNKVLIFVAGKDLLKYRGYDYFDKLKKSGFKGSVEIMESKGETHVFHLIKPSSPDAIAMMKRLVDFLNQPNYVLLE